MVLFLARFLVLILIKRNLNKLDMQIRKIILIISMLPPPSLHSTLERRKVMKVVKVKSHILMKKTISRLSTTATATAAAGSP